jgi:drug/metabolite transporter (DMT)-like permease
MLCGVLLFLASWTQQQGIALTSVANAGFFTGIYVVLIPLFSWLLLRQRPHLLIWPAVMLTVLGIALLNGGTLTRFQQGDIWVLVCSVFWSGQIMLVGYLASMTGRPVTLAWWQFLTTGVLGVMATQWVAPIEWLQIMATWRELLWSGVMSVGVAFTLQAVAQRHSPPAVAAVIMSSEMLFAALAGAWLLGERLSLMQLLGGALIFLAIVVVEVLPQWRGSAAAIGNSP